MSPPRHDVEPSRWQGVPEFPRRGSPSRWDSSRKSNTAACSPTEDPHARNPDGTFFTRTFRRFSDAANENAISRLYLGVHYRFQGDQDGIDLGDDVADAVISRPLMDQRGTIGCPAPYVVDSSFGPMNNPTAPGAPPNARSDQSNLIIVTNYAVRCGTKCS